MNDDSFVPYQLPRMGVEQMTALAESCYDQLSQRRSVRQFSAEPVPKRLIELAVATASTAPSGAHRQPWTFVAVSNPDLKRQIRIAAEREEYASYEGGRMPDEWRRALEPLGTDWRKPYLETAPWLVIVFEQTAGRDADGQTVKHYYVKESVGIACGLFIVALHQMGLATLTHTPSPMAFLSEILERPSNERPFILFPVGYPASDARVPDIHRKPLEDVIVWRE